MTFTNLVIDERIRYRYLHVKLDENDIRMDKLTLVSGTLFLAADIFAIVSLAMPDWIVTDVGGNFKIF